jgi:PilZ domain
MSMRTWSASPYKTAHKIVRTGKKFIFHEDLNLKGLTKRNQAKQAADGGDRVKIQFHEESLALEGRVLRSTRVGKGLCRVGIEFMAIDLVSRRRLVEWLYCEVHDFKQRRKPGSLDSIFFMLLSVFQLRSITRVYK